MANCVHSMRHLNLPVSQTTCIQYPHVGACSILSSRMVSGTLHEPLVAWVFERPVRRSLRGKLMRGRHGSCVSNCWRTRRLRKEGSADPSQGCVGVFIHADANYILPPTDATCQPLSFLCILFRAQRWCYWFKDRSLLRQPQSKNIQSLSNYCLV